MGDVLLTRISHHGPRWMRRKARRPRLAATVCVHRAAYSMSPSGRDESRPYILDGGDLLPLLPAPGEQYGLAGTARYSKPRAATVSLEGGDLQVAVSCASLGCRSSPGRKVIDSGNLSAEASLACLENEK